MKDIETPILITGCARSGTSMTAGIFHLCGAFGGDMSGPNRNNKKGMFENAAIRNELVKPYLKQLGCDPLGQDPLPDIEAVKEQGVENFRHKVLQVMWQQGYTEGPWFYKGAKMCLIWPLWIKAFPDARWIIVRREDDDIIHSCMRTGFMRAHTSPKGWQSWIDEHKKRFDEMKKVGLSVREVWPTKFIAGDFTEIKGAVEELGLTWNETAINEFISPTLWRGNNGESDRD